MCPVNFDFPINNKKKIFGINLDHVSFGDILMLKNVLVAYLKFEVNWVPRCLLAKSDTHTLFFFF